jgi:hypothetical protein
VGQGLGKAAEEIKRDALEALNRLWNPDTEGYVFTGSAALWTKLKKRRLGLAVGQAVAQASGPGLWPSYRNVGTTN